MSREIDRRDWTSTRWSADREATLRATASEVSDRLPGAHRVRIASFDPRTGNPAVVASLAAPAEDGNYVQRALDHVQNIHQALGFAASQPMEFAPDPNAQHTSSGAVAVHLQQQYKGIPIFQAAETVRFAPDGALAETAGSTVSVTSDPDAVPALSAEQAVAAAARYVAEPDPDETEEVDSFGEPMAPEHVDVEGFEPKVRAAFPDQPARPTTLEPGPFGDEIKAGLLWFAIDDELRLVWEVILTMPEYTSQYRCLVDAESGEILYCRQTVHSVAARGNVYRVDGSRPREMVDFPLPLAEYGLPLPDGLPDEFPEDWVAADRTEGNTVDAHLDRFGPSLRGTQQNGNVVFDPADPVGDDQKVLNIFYYNAYMRDFFYLLGFTEIAGNFQVDNLGRGGFGGDPVDARAFSGPVRGTANMLTPPDGGRPIMNMGLVTSTGNHTAFDSSVVFHEFMHGVTNRLVGGPLDARALDAPQSGGMGEGWGDYVACTINDTNVVGDWVVGNPRGIRGFPYDDQFPDSFGNLGTGRYRGVHNVGEIWCATLLAMNREIGKVLGVQLVVDALMLSPANPSFLDMRDAIFAALDNKLAAGQLDAAEHATARRGIWRVFARFGMGPGARSNGPSLEGIVADFSVPDEPAAEIVELETAPNLAIPDADPAGVESTLTVAASGRVDRIAVGFDIRHTFIGDLRVRLSAPSGREVTLHNGTGGGADDLIRAFSSDDSAALTAMVGEEAQGDWTLRVADLVGLDRGTLRRFSLRLELGG